MAKILVTDNSTVRELFGWTPRHGGHDELKRGFATTTTWFVKPDNLCGYKAGIYNL